MRDVPFRDYDNNPLAQAPTCSTAFTRAPGEIERAITAFARGSNGGLIVTGSAWAKVTAARCRSTKSLRGSARADIHTPSDRPTPALSKRITRRPVANPAINAGPNRQWCRCASTCTVPPSMLAAPVALILSDCPAALTLTR